MTRRPRQSAVSPEVSAKEEGEQARCGCGALLARMVAEGVELKCRRCGRMVLLETSSGSRTQGWRVVCNRH